MALTTEEQQTFDQIAAGWTADDPTPAVPHPDRMRSRGGAGWPAIAFVVGFVLLVAGLPAGPDAGIGISVVGLVLMAAAAVVGAPTPAWLNPSRSDHPASLSGGSRRSP